MKGVDQLFPAIVCNFVLYFAQNAATNSVVCIGCLYHAKAAKSAHCNPNLNNNDYTQLQKICWDFSKSLISQFSVAHIYCYEDLCV